jgi:hypothetical protein
MIPFNINVNNPRVNMFTGSVRIKRIGFKTAFTTAKTTATTTAVRKDCTWTPGRRYAVITTAMAFSNKLIRAFILL